jgi:hypothetical protein
VGRAQRASAKALATMRLRNLSRSSLRRRRRASASCKPDIAVTEIGAYPAVTGQQEMGRHIVCGIAVMENDGEPQQLVGVQLIGGG